MLCQMLKCLAALCLLASISLAQPPMPAPTASPEETSPNSLLRLFVDALNKNDVAAAARLVQGAPKGAALQIIQPELEKAHGPWTYEVREVNALYQGQLQDRVPAKIRLRLRDALGNKITHDERLNLQQEGNLWRIVPLLVEELIQSIDTQGESDILQNLASYLAHPQAIAQVRQRKCMNNLKQLALGALQFIFDANGKFAFTNKTYPQLLWPYTQTEAILHCPLDNDSNYFFNEKLENIALEKIENPHLTVLFYEGENRQLDFRHDNLAGVCFADGHIEMISPARAQTLKWQP